MEARVLTETDANAYRLMRLRSVEERPMLASPEVQRELAVFAERTTGLLSAYPAEGTLVWGAFDDPSLTGAVAVTRRFSPGQLRRLSLWGMYVRPSYRGTPASRILMEAVIAWYGQQPDEFKLHTWFSRDNIRARQLFDRYGFAETTEQTDLGLTESQAKQLVFMDRER